MLTHLRYLIYQSQALIVAVMLLVLLKVYVKVTTGTCRSTSRMDGKTIIITGANTGIGKETALNLARRGARVILACRNLEKAEKVKGEIILETGNYNIVAQHLDLASLKSVRHFSGKILRKETRMDVLINNAGVVGLKRSLTDDGLEYQMQSNHFGHFLLTSLLLGLMKKTGKARIICVSSIAHTLPKTLDFDNLNGQKDGDYRTIYGMSKLCNVLFANELARKTEGTGITVNSLHPGAIETDIFRHLPTHARLFVVIILRLFFKTAKEGAQTTIHLAVSDEVEGISGKYFADCKVTKESVLARDEVLAKKLWDVSRELVGLQQDELHL